MLDAERYQAKVLRVTTSGPHQLGALPEAALVGDLSLEHSPEGAARCHAEDEHETQRRTLHGTSDGVAPPLRS
jgi:hypothetical protein